MLPQENFEKMVQFGVYCDQIVSLKFLFLYKKIIITASRLLWGTYLPEKFRKTCHNRCFFVYILMEF